MKAKSFFSIFVAMAAIPLLLAYLTLQFNWFTPAATNKGQFMESEVTLQLDKSLPTWSIVYQPANQVCDTLCTEQLYGLNQTFIALGKLQKRVEALVLSNDLDLSKYPATQGIDKHFSALDGDHIYLVDPMGKVILKYPASEQREDTIQTSKFILSDIKKLLKYARVG